MYKTVIPDISRSMRFDDNYFYAGVKFVMHTIRRQFYAVRPTNRLSVMLEESLEDLYENKTNIRNRIIGARSLEERMLIVMDIKGLNMVKAGFVLQLMGYEIGCIDVHNCNRLGINTEELSMRKNAANYNPNKLWKYIGMCQSKKLGGAENMWDDWCALIAERYPSYYRTAEDVSVSHLNIIEEFYHKEISK